MLREIQKTVEHQLTQILKELFELENYSIPEPMYPEPGMGDLAYTIAFPLAKTLRKNPKWASTPIIVSSGTADPDAPARAERLGANAYFAKPYSPMKLRKTLANLLEGNKT